MNKAYDKIMRQNGFKDFKKLIDKWNVLSENIQKTPFNAPIMLPDIFLVSGSGTGRTNLLSLLSEYLYEKDNLMEFYGDVRYFEFRLNYCNPNEKFTEILRLMSEVSGAAGFRNEYKGIVYIDVDEWLGHCHEKHFIDFLEYMSDNSDKWLVVISVTDKNGDKIDELRGVVSAFLRIEQITIEAPTETELSQYLYDKISAYGLIADSSAMDILSKTVGLLGSTKYFDGYKTVKMLAQDIVYSVFSAAKNQSVISADDVKDFSETSEYVKRTLNKLERARRIGF